MKTHYDCVTCMLNGLISLFKQDLIDKEVQEKAFKKVLDYYSKINFEDSPLLINRNLHQLIRESSNNLDPYKKLKDKFNNEALKYYDKYKELLLTAENPMDLALRLAIAGNIIDFGPGHPINIEKTIEKVLNSELTIDDSSELFEEIKKAKNIVYLGDNTGEIVFDKLFLEIINRPDITFVVRNSPILNDATTEDAKNLGIDKLANIMTNGDCAPGTLLSHVSPEFKEVYDNADLIISKGQGNFEGLSEEKDKNIFFLLMIKCHIVADDLGVQKGDYIAKSLLKHQNKISK